MAAAASGACTIPTKVSTEKRGRKIRQLFELFDLDGVFISPPPFRRNITGTTLYRLPLFGSPSRLLDFGWESDGGSEVGKVSSSWSSSFLSSSSLRFSVSLAGCVCGIGLAHTIKTLPPGGLVPQLFYSATTPTLPAPRMTRLSPPSH